MPTPCTASPRCDGPTGGQIAFIDLAVSKTSSITTAAGNSSFSYTIDIVNNDPANAANHVVVEDALPANLSLASAVASQGSYDSGTGLWTIGTIAAGGGASLTLNVVVDDVLSPSTLTNTATTTAHNEPDADSTNNSDSVDVDLFPGPKLSVVKTVEVISDAIPENTSYVANSIALNVTSQGDATGEVDASDFDQSPPGAVTSAAGTISTNSILTLTFDVQID